MGSWEFRDPPVSKIVRQKLGKKIFVRQIQKLSVKFRNFPLKFEIVRQFHNCPPKFEIYFFFLKLSAYSPASGQFLKLSADNCPPNSQDPNNDIKNNDKIVKKFKNRCNK
jgi:hypothetical protein